jgi:hypothetical protein
MSECLKIGGIEIKRGESRSIEIKLPSLYTHASLSMPAQVIRGKRDGPSLFVSGAIHGDEINGVEVIRRLLRLNAMKSIRGSLIAVPVVNVYGFINQSRYLPDRRDLNRCFPGNVSGSLAGRLADLFMNEIVANSTHGIDIHTAAIHRDNLPQIRAHLEDPETARMAHAFNMPVILNSGLLEGSMRQASFVKATPVIVYEAGEALRFDEMAIRAGVKGVISVMRELGMLPKIKPRKNPIEPFVARSSTWVRANQSGILRVMVHLGSRVKKDDLLGVIADPFGEYEQQLTASFDGIVVGRTNLPLVNEGEALFHIARFSRPDEVAGNVEAFNYEMDPDTDLRQPAEIPIV